MRCRDVRDELALFVDGSLDREVEARVAAHLAGCAACAAEVAEVRALLGQVQRARPDEERSERHWQSLARDIRAATDALPPPGVAWWRRPIAWAGGLAVAAAVAATLLIARSTPTPTPATATRPAAVAAPAAVEEIIDEELALGSPAAADEELEELDLDDAAAARVEAAL